jgi:hypothetical protein
MQMLRVRYEGQLSEKNALIDRLRFELDALIRELEVLQNQPSNGRGKLLM